MYTTVEVKCLLQHLLQQLLPAYYNITTVITTLVYFDQGTITTTLKGLVHVFKILISTRQLVGGTVMILNYLKIPFSENDLCVIEKKKELHCCLFNKSLFPDSFSHQTKGLGMRLEPYLTHSIKCYVYA